MAAKISYSKKTRVTLTLAEEDILAAVRRLAQAHVDIPASAEIDFEISQGALVKGATVWWDETEHSEEEID